jgi:hypothetical protein
MEQAADNGDQHALVDPSRIAVTAAFEGSEEIAAARELARTFLTDLQAVHGLPVSGRVMGMVQLVVSELVTNARIRARPLHADPGGLRRRRRRHRVGQRTDVADRPRR